MSVSLLFGGLSGGQGGGYRAARLGHIKELLFISARCYQTLMLVTPHHQVKKVVQELLGNVVGGSMFTPREKKCKINHQIIRIEFFCTFFIILG